MRRSTTSPVSGARVRRSVRRRCGWRAPGRRWRRAATCSSSKISTCRTAIQVLVRASLRVPGGGVHALVGRNGVGKTTLLNAIAGLVEWRSGRVLYDGLDLTGVPPDQRVGSGSR